MRYFYRPHRGGLKEAMEEKKFFDTLDEMTEYIVNRHNEYSIKTINDNDVSYHKYSDGDYRIGWKSTYIVMANNYPVGFFTDDYEENWEEIYKQFLQKSY